MKKDKKVIAVLAALCIAGSAGLGVAAPRGEGGRGEGGDVRVQRDGGDRGDRGDRGGNNFDRDGGKRGVDADARRGRDRADWRGPGYRDRIRRGQRYSWGPGVAFYFSDGYYYGECRWVKRRAIETGSRVWWRRYERCRDFN